MLNISKKTCFPSTRKVLDFDLNGQHMRKTEVPEGNWVLGCSPDHSTIRPKSERLASRRKVVSSGFHSLVVLVFLLILSIFDIYFVHDCRYIFKTPVTRHKTGRVSINKSPNPNRSGNSFMENITTSNLRNILFSNLIRFNK